MKRMLNVAGMAAGLVALGCLGFAWTEAVGERSGSVEGARVQAGQERETQPEEGVLLRVIDADSGAPVSGATVRFLDPDVPGAMGEGWRPIRLRAHESAQVDALGSIHQTDEKGELRLPAFGKRAYVSASHDGLYDFATLRANRRKPIVLKLVRDETVRVQVLDPAGNPCAGVPVALRPYHEEKSEDGTGRETAGGGGRGSFRSMSPNASRPRDLAEVYTAGSEGIAELRHVQEIVRPKVERRMHSVAIACLLAEPVEIGIGDDRSSEEPLVLQLPETGEVEVRVVDVNGEPLLDENLTVALELALEADGRSARFGSFLEKETPAPKGRAVFRYVGLGVNLDAWALRDWLSAPLEGSGKGPTEAGARVTLTLKCTAPDCLLRGRLLDGAGRPLAGTEVTFGVSWREGRAAGSGMRQVDTDEEGGFEVLLGPGPYAGWSSLELEIRHRDPQSRKTTSARIDLPREPTPGEVDLGDVVLDTSPR